MGVHVFGCEDDGAGAAVLAETGLAPEPAEGSVRGEGGGEVGSVCDVVPLTVILELDADALVDDAYIVGKLHII